LDADTLARWQKYLRDPVQHPFLKPWFATGSREAAIDFQNRVLSVLREKKQIDDKNQVLLGVDLKQMKDAVFLSLDRNNFLLWHDLFGEGSTNQADGLPANAGLLRYNEK